MRNMKKVSAILSLAALCSTLLVADPLAKTFRQVYDLDPAKVNVYAKTLAVDVLADPVYLVEIKKKRIAEYLKNVDIRGLINSSDAYETVK